MGVQCSKSREMLSCASQTFATTVRLSAVALVSELSAPASRVVASATVPMFTVPVVELTVGTEAVDEGLPVLVCDVLGVLKVDEVGAVLSEEELDTERERERSTHHSYRAR